MLGPVSNVQLDKYRIYWNEDSLKRALVHRTLATYSVLCKCFYNSPLTGRAEVWHFCLFNFWLDKRVGKKFCIQRLSARRYNLWETWIVSKNYFSSITEYVVLKWSVYLGTFFLIFKIISLTKGVANSAF